MLENLITLVLLILLQAVLGFDNLLYISLESKRAPEDKRAAVRKAGIGLAIVLRIVLLFVLLHLIEYFREPLFSIDLLGWVVGAFSVHSLIVLAGGVFIIYTATREVFHMMTLEEEAEVRRAETEGKSVERVVASIVVMNLVFSFDSILSAIALTHVFWVMAIAIVVSGVLMIYLADHVSRFLQKNRMYEVLGLFILFIVGIMLVTEGGHLAELDFFGQRIAAMSKTTFYFVITILVLVDLVQSRYQRKILAQKEASGGKAG